MNLTIIGNENVIWFMWPRVGLLWARQWIRVPWRSGYLFAGLVTISFSKMSLLCS